MFELGQMLIAAFSAAIGFVIFGLMRKIKELEGEVAFQKALVRGWEETFARFKKEGKL